MKNIINWQIFTILFSLCLISVICVFPYVLTLQGDVLRSTGISIPILFVVQLIQSAILFGLVTFAGLWFSKRIGFQLPVLEKLTQGKAVKTELQKILKPAVLSGIGVAVTIYASDYLFSLLGADLSTHQNLAPIWQKLLAALYGGIAEEVLMRLFLMSLFIWLGIKVFRTSRPTPPMIWGAMMLAAVAFGIGHLPITAALTAITPVIVIRAIILNGIGGIVFGWLFWKKGLEAAIIAHFTTDIVLLTLIPLVLR